MIPLTLDEIAAISGGTLTDAPDPGATVTAPLAFDSRLPIIGSLFLCLSGEGNRDGHDFAAAATDAGAVGVLATRPVGVPAIVVADVLQAAAELTRHLSGKLTGTSVIGLTGSSGKTSTKDLIAQILPGLGSTVATEQSFNNEFGVPVTVSRADASTRFLVLEMGAKGIGHIRDLTRMAPLESGIVLNVGAAHLGKFGSRDAVAQAKGELVENLPSTGYAILNADDPNVLPMAARTRATVITFGLGDHALVRAHDVRLDDQGRAGFTLDSPQGSAPVQLRVVGEHYVSNALAAAALALAYGMPPQATADALSAAEPISAGRMQVTDRADGLTVVNDAYNANPDSVRAALHALAALTGPTGRRGIAVLGPMLELGPTSEQDHADAGALAASLGFDVVAVGSTPDAYAIASGAGARAVLAATDREDALRQLQSLARPGDVVLVKASRDSGLRWLADSLVTASSEEQWTRA
ncbi:UDP-N-acetylmuramoyl-tripeptide--D-alanyl-D-alanine ligase [Streptomyces sp. 846.5]|nr:UDP-N-acetylmuramoyl-tripeptide--D-alanyl-D-alanine ligase [Streptomyces sp. 846.5]TDT93329.1 UDP-N-acetylmuramoyl-tripeptide--D-alanyl-D-alanine ligase [Streptomyces sp. 846.5]